MHDGSGSAGKLGILCMQAEGLALALGGREALRELLEQGKPVLAAHGPYTAAGDSCSDFTPQAHSACRPLWQSTYGSVHGCMCLHLV